MRSKGLMLELLTKHSINCTFSNCNSFDRNNIMLHNNRFYKTEQAKYGPCRFAF